ncbi:MAG: 2OG-Fe(II) oxygenase, partial [Pyrinomonadaceae bacterium]
MSSELAQYIVDRLEMDLDAIAEDFARERAVATRFAAIDDLFPPAIAGAIHRAFPPVAEMHLLDSFREKKYTSRSLDKFDPLIADAIFAFQDSRVIELVSRITGQKDVVGDPLLYAGGISSMVQGHFLNPHIDNSHDREQKNYRVLNLLYYCS